MGKLILFGLIAFAMSAVKAAEVDYLGQTSMGLYFVDNDSLHIGNCPSAMNEPIQRIKLKITTADVRIESLSVRFGNGQREVYQVRQSFRPGSESGWIDLQGGSRCVEEISITGRTLNFFREGKVLFYGLRGDSRPNLSPIRMLGRVYIGNARDSEVIRLAPCPNFRNTTSAIQLRVRNNSVNIQRLVLNYGNGQRQDIALRNIIRAGTSSEVRALDGRNRCIESIQMVGRTIGRGPQANVEVWAVDRN